MESPQSSAAPIILSEFNISSGQYMRILYSQYLKRRWLVLALPVIACAALAYWNLNFIFVALMLIFVIFPMLLTFLFFYYGMLPEVRISLLPKQLSLSVDNIAITFVSSRANATEASAISANNTAQDAATEGPVTPQRTPSPITIPLTDISKITPTKHHLLLHFASRQFLYLVIPYTAFTPESLADFVTTFNNSKAH